MGLRKVSILRVSTFLLGLLVSLVALFGSGSASSRSEAVELPTPPGSFAPNVSVHENRLYLSWLTEEESGHKLQFSKLEKGAWSSVRTVAEGPDFFANWADVPSVVELEDGTLLAHWLSKKSAEDTYAYDVMLSRSTDGEHWSEPMRPHDDGTHTEHGFVSIIPTKGEESLVMWLDGRDYAGKEHDEAQMSLRAASVTTGRVDDSEVVDSRTCDCCPTDAVRTGGAILLAYRDRSKEEIRDISLVRQENNTWSEPYALSNDGWQISGCPVNGPSLDARASNVVASWYTISKQEPMVRLAFSSDAGQTFPVNIRIDEGAALGRSDLLLLSSGEALVAWLSSPPEGEAEIRARLVAPDGTIKDSFLVTETSAERSSGFHRLASVGDEQYIFWTEVGEQSEVRMARLVLAH